MLPTGTGWLLSMPGGASTLRDNGCIGQLGLLQVVWPQLVSAGVASRRPQSEHIIQGAICRTTGGHSLGKALKGVRDGWRWGRY